MFDVKEWGGAGGWEGGRCQLVHTNVSDFLKAFWLKFTTRFFLSGFLMPYETILEHFMPLPAFVSQFYMMAYIIKCVWSGIGFYSEETQVFFF